LDFPWSIFIDFGVISVALLLATALRARVSFFQRYLIPNNLIAGFLLLFFYNALAPRLGLTTAGLDALVYHLLNLSFVAMVLRPSARSKRGKGIGGTVVGLLSQYAVQAVLGLSFTLIFILTLIPPMHPAFGLFIPLGFALGPGQAFAIGKNWESYGFDGAPSVGLTFAAIGFVWACFGGVLLINKGIRLGWVSRDELSTFDRKGTRTGIYGKDESRPAGSKLSTETEAIDGFSYNLALVFVSYLITYLMLKGLTWGLSFAGNAGKDLAKNLWGIGFIFCAFGAMLLKNILGLLKVDWTIDEGTMNRIGGGAIDYMVAGSLGAISIAVVTTYWFPILLMSSIAGLQALVIVPWMASRMFDDHRFHRALIIYGASTGTLPTGLALLRVIDPDFETPVVSDYMYASGFVFMFAIPFILMLPLPGYGYVSGDPSYYWITGGICAAYLVATLVAYTVLSRRNACKDPFRLWLRK